MTEQRPDSRTGTAPDAARTGAGAGAGHGEAMQVWAQRRAGGRASFIWRYGVLGWGLPAALITVAYAVIKEHGFVVSGPFSTKLRIGIALAVIVFPTLGHLFGRRMWETGEERYERFTKGGGTK